MPETFHIFAQFFKETFCETLLSFISEYEFSATGICLYLKAYDILRIWLVR